MKVELASNRNTYSKRKNEYGIPLVNFSLGTWMGNSGVFAPDTTVTYWYSLHPQRKQTPSNTDTPPFLEIGMIFDEVEITLVWYEE